MDTPNLRAYLGALLGEQMYLAPPGVGLIGAITLIIFAHHSGADGLVGRFGGAVVLLLTALYLPYFWQDPRFLMAPAVFLSLATSIALPRLINRVMRAGRPIFSSARSRSTGDIAPLR